MKIGYGYIPVRFGIDPRRILLLDFPARDTLRITLGWDRGRKAISRATLG